MNKAKKKHQLDLPKQQELFPRRVVTSGPGQPYIKHAVRKELDLDVFAFILEDMVLQMSMRDAQRKHLLRVLMARVDQMR